MIKPKSFFIVCFSIVVLYSCKSTQNTTVVSNQKPKNVLFIAIDDLKPLLGSYGNELIKTPNMDKLANSGFVFLNNHCQQAVCGPSRASILTGKRPDYTQIWDLKTLMREKNPNIVTMPQHFKKFGYQTVAVGKIFDPRCVDKTYDSISWTIPYGKIKNKEYAFSKEKVSFEANQRPIEETIDGEIVANSVNYLNQFAKTDKPFFLAVGLKKPHLPFVAHQKYWDLYKREQFKLPTYRVAPSGAPEYAIQPSWELRSGYSDVPKNESTPMTDDFQISLIHGYHACVSFIDDLVGQLINELDKLGLRENTIIVLWGDHGFHLGDHGMFCKHTNYEQSTRSPLIISAPNTSKGKTNSPSEFVDVFPTLCELTNVPVANSLDGKSLVPVMTKKTIKVKDFAVSQFPRNNDLMGYSFRNEKYRYTVWLEDYSTKIGFDEKLVVAEELYDYEKDAEETKNLVNEKDYQKIKNELKELSKTFFKSQL